MHEHQDLFRRVVTQLCEAVGLARPSADEDFHFELDGHVVALLHHPEVRPELLHICADLGPMQTRDLHRSLLELNVPLAGGDGGCFGLHPATGSVVYRTSLQLTADLDGAGLPGWIHEIVSGALARSQDQAV